MASKVPGRKGDPNLRTPTNWPTSKTFAKLSKGTVAEYLIAMMAIAGGGREDGDEGTLMEYQFLELKHCTAAGLAEMVRAGVAEIAGQDSDGDDVYRFKGWDDHMRTNEEKSEANAKASRAGRASAAKRASGEGWKTGPRATPKKNDPPVGLVDNGDGTYEI